MEAGSVQDLFYLIIVLFTVSIFAVFTGYAVLEGQAAIEKTDVSNNQTAQVKSNYEAGLSALDSSILFFFIFSCIMAIALAFLIPSHPIFLVFSILFLIIAILMAVIFSNLYGAVVSTEGLATVKSHFPLTWFLWEHMATIAAGTGIAVIIASYISSRGGMT